MDLGTIARDAVRESASAIEVPEPLPEAWRSFVGLYTAPHFGTVVRVEWLDGKLTVLDPDTPTWKPTLAPTDNPDVFTIEAGFRESGELAHFERAGDGRVVSLFLAVSRLQRLAPASDAR
jgi:hypothetical protein